VLGWLMPREEFAPSLTKNHRATISTENEKFPAQVEELALKFDQLKAQNTLAEIYGFHAIGDRLGTAGQPMEAQFGLVRESGFKVVINLALPTSDNAIAHEASVVTGLGMAYVHIPVNFTAPTAEDFRAFCRVMDAFDDRPVFVHCAANMRVSSFVFLYRVLSQKVPVSVAESDLHAIWQPDQVWSQFIQRQLNT
jgi:protein tyrosine phosphatase (PTP) superfamily phosphohydrolase (DUF442 family)